MTTLNLYWLCSGCDDPAKNKNGYTTASFAYPTWLLVFIEMKNWRVEKLTVMYFPLIKLKNSFFRKEKPYEKEN